MSLSARREAVNAAEAEVVLSHQSMQRHMQAFGEARGSLFTPGRIVVGGLAIGFIIGKAVPALRRSEVRRDFDRGTDALQRLIGIARSAMPLLMPVWAAVTASRAKDASEKAEAAQATAAGTPPPDTLH